VSEEVYSRAAAEAAEEAVRGGGALHSVEAAHGSRVTGKCEAEE
jgi:hypothetical protein